MGIVFVITIIVKLASRQSLESYCGYTTDESYGPLDDIRAEGGLNVRDDFQPYLLLHFQPQRRAISCRTTCRTLPRSFVHAAHFDFEAFEGH